MRFRTQPVTTTTSPHVQAAGRRKTIEEEDHVI